LSLAKRGEKTSEPVNKGRFRDLRRSLWRDRILKIEPPNLFPASRSLAKGEIPWSESLRAAAPLNFAGKLLANFQAENSFQGSEGSAMSAESATKSFIYSHGGRCSPLGRNGQHCRQELLELVSFSHPSPIGPEILDPFWRWLGNLGFFYPRGRSLSSGRLQGFSGGTET